MYKVFTLSLYSSRKLSYFSSLSQALTLCHGRLASISDLFNLELKPLACGTEVED
jgi:hypothetical protein